MSEKKGDLNAAENSLADIQIVTLLNDKAVRLSVVKEKEKEQAQAQPISQTLIQATPQKQIKEEDPVLKSPEQNVSSGIGDRYSEDKIREHVEEIMRNQRGQQNQSDDGDEGEESNISQEEKSQKSEKKEKSQAQSNQQRKQQLPTSRKCFNKLCSSKKIYKKIRSRVQENKYRFFCKNCYQNYYHNLYCEFCEQIYSNNCENEDDDKWIGCDNCDRWNHIECQRRYRDKNINDLKDKNLLYECLVCSQKSKINNEKTKKGEKEPVEQKIPIKQKIQINKDQRIPIFHKKNESFPNLQYFLQNYSFRLWMNENQIREDIQMLRNTCLRMPQEESLKGKKKIKPNE